MTMDKSLRVRRGLIRSRSVLTRGRTLGSPPRADRWKAGDSPVGLPKVRVYKLSMKKKKKKKEEEGEEGDKKAGDKKATRSRPARSKPPSGPRGMADPACLAAGLVRAAPPWCLRMLRCQNCEAIVRLSAPGSRCCRVVTRQPQFPEGRLCRVSSGAARERLGD